MTPEQAEIDRERRILETRERLHTLGVAADDWDDGAVGRILRLLDEAEAYRRDCPFSLPILTPPPDPEPAICFRYRCDGRPIMTRLPASAYITGLA